MAWDALVLIAFNTRNIETMYKAQQNQLIKRIKII